MNKFSAMILFFVPSEHFSIIWSRNLTRNFFPGDSRSRREIWSTPAGKGRYLESQIFQRGLFSEQFDEAMWDFEATTLQYCIEMNYIVIDNPVIGWWNERDLIVGL